VNNNPYYKGFIKENKELEDNTINELIVKNLEEKYA
jgi:hypothetical protein